TLSACDHHFQKIQEYQHIHRQQAEADQRDPAYDLEYLPGQEGSGDEQGKVLGPGFFKIQANSLHQVKSGVDKNHLADPPEQTVIDQRSLFQQNVDDARLGIKAHVVGHSLQHITDILVQQLQSTHADGRK